jgi:D-xylose transport system permease protein
VRFALLLVLLLWVHLGDLTSAWLYNLWPQAAELRHLRDALAVILAACCLLTTRLPTQLLLPMLGYGGLAAIYLILGIGDAPLSLQIASFGTLVIPLLFFLAAYYCVRTPGQLRTLSACLVVLALASTLFGAWDQQNTEFWLYGIDYPRYMLEVKGMLVGGNPENGLPWNFYGGLELERRAAGLLASPLAQGMFLCVGALLAVAWLQGRASMLGLLLCAVLFAGIWMSGTRGAMLAAGLALLGYLFCDRTLLPGRGWRWLILGASALAIVVASWQIVLISVKFLDGSTIGHWMALQKNLQDLPKVLLFGAGLGQQGGMAGNIAATTIGGGEGAIFSIAFQLGLPAALLFLLFLTNLALQLWHHYRIQREPLALAATWLLLGISTTLISSEHMLSVSGSGALWLLCGAALRSLNMARARMQHELSDP